MRKLILIACVLAGWLHARPGMAQFGQNPVLPNNLPQNLNILPRSGAGYLGNQQRSPIANNGGGFNGFNNNGFNNFNNNGFNGFNNFNNNGFNGFNNFNNNGFNGFNNFNSYGFNGYGSTFNNYGSPFNNMYANPWSGNTFASGAYNNPFPNLWNYGNNFYGPAPPYGGYQFSGFGNFSGYGNFAPIVGVNNGWWPYQPAYNPNNPVNQYLLNLFQQGLPNLNNLPGNQVLPKQ